MDLRQSPPLHHPTRLVIVEGNIASGKTSFLQYFEKRYAERAEVVYEPVERWRRFHGHNLLGLFYADPAKYSFSLQTYVQLTITELLVKPWTRPTRIMERSLFSAFHCFTENLYRSGKMSEPDYLLIRDWYEFILRTFPQARPDLVVYLRTSPSVLRERLVKRQRPEEASISLDYLTQLHNFYEHWLGNAAEEEAEAAHVPRLSDMFNGHCRVLTIDADRTFEDVCAQYEQNLHLLLASEHPDSSISITDTHLSPGAHALPSPSRVLTPKSAADTPVKRLLDSSGGIEGLIAAAAAIPRLPLSPKDAVAAAAKLESPSGAKRIRSPVKSRSPKRGVDTDENVSAPARAIV